MPRVISVRRAAGFTVIILWSGSIASIPSGFALCDGSGSTPDLRDEFVAAFVAPEYGGFRHWGDSNGAPASVDRSHWHNEDPTPQGSLHDHSIGGFNTDNDGGQLFGVVYPTGVSVGTDHVHSIPPITTSTDISPVNPPPVTQTHDHTMPNTTTYSEVVSVFPLYYALAYIQGVVDDVPVGGIVNYAGDPTKIPPNFHQCDGTGGTPLLAITIPFGGEVINTESLFVEGAGGVESVNATDPSQTHIDVDGLLVHDHTVGSVVTVTEDTHEHNIYYGAGISQTDDTSTGTVTVDGGQLPLADVTLDPHHHQINANIAGEPTTSNSGHDHNPVDTTQPWSSGTSAGGLSTIAPARYIGFIMRLS